MQNMDGSNIYEEYSFKQEYQIVEEPIGFLRLYDDALELYVYDAHNEYDGMLNEIKYSGI